MSRIIPIPTTRVGDFFVRQRLTQQVQADQLALFRLQSQVSTGLRLQVPSDDAPAALRAINLQRLLDRHGQIQTNVQANNSFLSAAENQLSLVSQQLNELRGSVLSASGTLTPEAERQAVIQQLDRMLQLLVDTGNSRSQSGYLFAGSRSLTQPYDYNGSYVEYHGNEGHLRTYVDLERLFDTNLPGTQVFGGISGGVEGSVDLNPHLTANTKLSTLNGGQGISRDAAIAVSITAGGPTVTTVIDLSKAVTIGDVARLIEAGAPPEGLVSVEITGTGLTVRSAAGSVAISEVAAGRTARELGIFTSPSSAPTNEVVGSDLNPAILKTTRLTDLLGTKAQGRITSDGENNDLLIVANQNGEEFNYVRVEFVAGGVAGSEVVEFEYDEDEEEWVLRVTVQEGVSSAAQVAAAITEQGVFTAAVDRFDATSSSQAGTQAVEVADFGAITSGGSGEALDTTSGLIITNGGEPVTLDISEAETVEDLLNLLNGANLGLLAEINVAGNGINIRSRLSGADLTIGESGGTTATQLGVRSYTGDTKLADFNRGLGVFTSNDPADDDFIITARDGTSLSINVSAAATVEDVINLINNHPDNNQGTTAVLARLAVVGNGIELVDASTATVGDLIVEVVEGSRAAEHLGFLSTGQAQVTAGTPDGDGNFVLASEDRHTLETDSVFNTLIRLRTALQEGDVIEIGRGLERLEDDLNRVVFARADLGARLQSMDVIGVRLQDESVQFRSALSLELDVDLVKAISDLTARQFAFEASLRTAGSMLQMSLLNFI